MVKWIDYRVQYSSGWTDWEIAEVNKGFNHANEDDMDWLARKEGIVRDDDHYRGIEVRDAEPSIEYLDRRIDVLNAEMQCLDKLRNFYIDTLQKKVHEG